MPPVPNRPMDHNGTSLRGYVTTTAHNILAKLGPPDYWEKGEPSDKVSIEWQVFTPEPEKIPFTIYDWKRHTEVGPDEIYEFHIGAHSRDDASKAIAYMRGLGLKGTFKLER